MTITRNKGIETVIKALPQIVKKHPEVLYMVLGKTHTSVLRHSGEEYRNYLQKLIKTLKLNEHVLLLNEFIDEVELFKYLSACDIYITPFINEAQITSGTLSYAMGSGCAVVSTPYWHAAELLADNKGRLFDFNNQNALAQNLNELLEEPEILKEIQKKASEYGQNITWPKIGLKYATLIEEILSEPNQSLKKKEPDLDPLLLPPFSLVHIKRLTDDTGISNMRNLGFLT